MRRKIIDEPFRAAAKDVNYNKYQQQLQQMQQGC